MSTKKTQIVTDSLKSGSYRVTYFDGDGKETEKTTVSKPIKGSDETISGEKSETYAIFDAPPVAVESTET